MKYKHFNNFIVLVTGVVRNKKGQILLIKRSKANKTFRGFWQLPEGKMEFGEQPVETLKREIKEELGCQLISTKPKAVKTSVVKFQETFYHVLRIVLEVKCKGKLKLSKEHDVYQWTSVKKAINLSNLVDGTKEILLGLKIKN